MCLIERLHDAGRAARTKARWRVPALLVLLSLVHGALAPALAAPPAGRAQFRSYGAEAGLANVAVLQLLQSRDGFVWAGTDDGLYSYDGYRFDGFGLDDGLPSTTIEVLFEDAGGLLWVGTKAGLAHRSGRGFAALGRADGLPAIPINALAQNGAGIHVMTSEGPFVGERGRRFTPMAAWPGGEATAALQAKRSAALWIGRWNGVASMAVLRGGRWQTLEAAPGAPRERIDAIAEDGAGALWARTATSLWLLDPGASKFALAPTPVALNSTRGYLATGRRGQLYVPTDSTLLRHSGGRWEELGQERGLPGGPRPVLEDREGSLWVGSVGLHRLLGRGVFHAFTTRDGLPGDVVWSVLRDSAGRLWVGTSAGLALWENGRFRALEGTKGNTIRSIVEGAGGVLFMAGAPGHEILRYDPASGNLRRHPLNADNPSSRIFRLLMDREGTLWASTDRAGLWRAASGAAVLAFERVALPAGDAGEYISDVRQDRAGRIWAAGQHGLALLEDGRWQRFGTAHGLRRDYIAYVLPLAGGDLLLPYFDPLGMARARYEHGRLTQVRNYDALSTQSANKVFLVGEDARGRLWIGGGRGIDMLDAGGARHFGAAEGLVGEDTASMAFLADPNGDVWFGTTKGLVRFDQAAFAALPPEKAPATVLQSIVLGGLDRDAGERAAGAAHDSTFDVRFAGTSFVGEGKLQYRLRLAGHEEAFIVTESRSARYSALRGGSYRFEVAARIGPHGAWGPGTTFAFVVRPAWWQTWWWYALVACATAMLGTFGYQSRTAHMRRENLRLERLVAARTGDLQVANAALQEASMIDPLTGLKNRRFLNAYMPEEIAHTLRQHKRDLRGMPAGADRNIDLCLLMVDLDHFKRVNDEHGHGAGDKVLRQVAKVLHEACRASDVLVRWGGEEFLILARNTDREHATSLAGQICAAVRAHPFDLGDGIVLHKTCSLGYTAFPLLPGAPERFDWEQAVELADQCLYAAKNSGRDGWVGCLLQEGGAGAAGAIVRPGYGACSVRSGWPADHPLRWQQDQGEGGGVAT
ncbi:MAG: diguanylate cyclase [Pseudomonadota bacterium]